MNRSAHYVARWRALLWIGGVLLFAACGGPPARPPSQPLQQVGLASYYAPQLQGRITASGERYDGSAFTAAHRDLPFGTLVEVVHVASGRSVQVRINDRGPFVKGRIIDLSHAAAAQLKIVEAGVARVRVTILPPGKNSR